MSSFPGTRVLRRLVRIRLELATRNVVGVLLDVGVPLLGQVVQREDRRNGADRNAGTAVDALNRVDEELVYRIEPRPAVFVLRILFRMDAIDRAGVHARGIFRSDAGLRNDIRHKTFFKNLPTSPIPQMRMSGRSLRVALEPEKSFTERKAINFV